MEEIVKASSAFVASLQKCHSFPSTCMMEFSEMGDRPLKVAIVGSGASETLNALVRDFLFPSDGALIPTELKHGDTGCLRVTRAGNTTVSPLTCTPATPCGARARYLKDKFKALQEEALLTGVPTSLVVEYPFENCFSVPLTLTTDSSECDLFFTADKEGSTVTLQGPGGVVTAEPYAALLGIMAEVQSDARTQFQAVVDAVEAALCQSIARTAQSRREAAAAMNVCTAAMASTVPELRQVAQMSHTPSEDAPHKFHLNFAALNQLDLFTPRGAANAFLSPGTVESVSTSSFSLVEDDPEVLVDAADVPPALVAPSLDIDAHLNFKEQANDTDPCLEQAVGKYPRLLRPPDHSLSFLDWMPNTIAKWVPAQKASVTVRPNLAAGTQPWVPTQHAPQWQANKVPWKPQQSTWSAEAEALIRKTTPWTKPSEAPIRKTTPWTKPSEAPMRKTTLWTKPSEWVPSTEQWTPNTEAWEPAAPTWVPSAEFYETPCEL